ncbi:MAG: dehydratase [Hyphomicrobiales bacterium]|nr:dehydratase [Hyphomicrobiales bacterium]
MQGFHVEIGATVSFSKTVSESDVYLFAGITGDLSPNHVNKAYMEKSSYGRLMAHGALMVGFMSTASTMAIAHTRDTDETPVSLGYDRIRFLKPVFLGDTITVHYEITEIDVERKRSVATVRITNQDGELTTVAQHILKWVPNDEAVG